MDCTTSSFCPLIVAPTIEKSIASVDSTEGDHWALAWRERCSVQRNIPTRDETLQNR